MWVLVICVFQETGPFHLSYEIEQSIKIHEAKTGRAETNKYTIILGLQHTIIGNY